MRTNREKENSWEIYRWYASLLLTIVALLTFFTIPSARQRLQRRMDGLFSSGNDSAKMVPVPGTLPPAAIPAQPSGNAAPATRPPSPAEVYLNAALRRNRPGEASTKAESNQPKSPAPAIEEAPQGGKPVLRRSTRITGSSSLASEEESPAPAPQASGLSKKEKATIADATSGNDGQAAFKILLDKVPSMASLQNNTLPGMQMVSWKVVKEDNPEIWIAVVGRSSGGDQEETFVWKINVSDLSVSPLSQAARRVASQK